MEMEGCTHLFFDLIKVGKVLINEDYFQFYLEFCGYLKKILIVSLSDQRGGPQMVCLIVFQMLLLLVLQNFDIDGFFVSFF